MTNGSGWHPLSHGEVLLQDNDEIIFRQIRLEFLSADSMIDSPVFQPRPEDEGKLSVHRALKVTAKEAADQFSEYHDEPSVGYARVKVGDVHFIGLRVIDDFGTGSVAKPESTDAVRFSGVARPPERPPDMGECRCQ